MSPSSASGAIGAPDMGLARPAVVATRAGGGTVRASAARQVVPAAARWPTVSCRGGESLLTCGTAVPAKGGPPMIARRLGEEAI
jgi:hypothetical protein